MSEEKQIRRVINLYAGPGVGKSTTMAALFAELKYQGFNTEIVTEVAKDAAWEGRGAKFFKAQDHIFGKQHWRMERCIEDTEFVITDAPLLQNIVYGKDFELPALQHMIKEAYDSYDNIDVLLLRGSSKPYQPKGRFQTLEEALVKDIEIKEMLDRFKVPYIQMEFGRDNPENIIHFMRGRGWLH